MTLKKVPHRHGSKKRDFIKKKKKNWSVKRGQVFGKRLVPKTAF